MLHNQVELLFYLGIKVGVLGNLLLFSLNIASVCLFVITLL